MKHIKKFENFEINEEILGFGKGAGEKAYQLTANFLEGDSNEAKEVKDLYNKIKESGKPERDPENLRTMQKITAIGAKWANANKMDSRDYSYSQIKTVLEKDWDRFFKGGVNTSVGESFGYRRNRR